MVDKFSRLFFSSYGNEKKLIIETFIFIGARIGELVNLNIDDLRDGNLFISSKK